MREGSRKTGTAQAETNGSAVDGRALGLSQRRVCHLLNVDWNTFRYCSRSREDAALQTRNVRLRPPSEAMGALRSTSVYGGKAGG